MKTKWYNVFFLMAVLVLASCGKEQMPGQATTGQPFELELGESTFFEKGEFKVFFSQLLSEGRCPTSVECISSGEAKIKVLIQKDGTAVESFELGTPPGQFQASTASYGDFTVRLLEVSPYPTTTKPIPSESYAIRLQID